MRYLFSRRVRYWVFLGVFRRFVLSLFGIIMGVSSKAESKRVIITIDGLAGTGKTTISLLLAEKLGFIHFSTGLLYRAVGLLLLTDKIDSNDQNLALETVRKHSIKLGISENLISASVLIDGVDVTEQLYIPEVSESTSRAAQHSAIRRELLELQRQAFLGKNLVVEGRDAGSVVFPEADLKFYIETKESVKVERRLKQLEERLAGKSASELNNLKEQMKIEIHERDERDQSRALSPTKCMPDMVFIDNSSQPLEFVVEKMYKVVTERGICPGLPG